jgi:uncharacterized protein YehS (DUF1456 family)
MLLIDVLRRLRYALTLDNSATISIFKLVDYELEEEYLTNMMRREDEEGFLPCRDKIMGLFLDGLILKKRGKREGTPPLRVLQAGERLSNNDVLRKIKIAMNYQQDDMMRILRTAGFPVSKGELTALFRKSDHRSYRVCGDQLLRNFLQGMVKTYRPEAHQKK